ncbi:hypothetical protein [Enterobacter asburiae]
MRAIDKIEVTITWPNGEKETGIARQLPVTTGQACTEFMTMFRENDDAGVIINLRQIAKLEYKIHFRDETPVTKLSEDIQLGSRLTNHRFSV